jgi:DNA-binding NarL/FixJ family response regulator
MGALRRGWRCRHSPVAYGRLSLVLWRTIVVTLATIRDSAQIRNAYQATPPEELVRAVRVVAAGDSLLAPEVTRRLIEGFCPPSKRTSPESS